MDKNKLYRYEQWLSQLELASAKSGLSKQQIAYVLAEAWHRDLCPLLEWSESQEFLAQFLYGKEEDKKMYELHNKKNENTYRLLHNKVHSIFMSCQDVGDLLQLLVPPEYFTLHDRYIGIARQLRIVQLEADRLSQDIKNIEHDFVSFEHLQDLESRGFFQDSYGLFSGLKVLYESMKKERGVQEGEDVENYIKCFMTETDGYLPGWYFSDESEQLHGPFGTKQETEDLCRNYIKQRGL